jgi:hypothetical protein
MVEIWLIKEFCEEELISVPKQETGPNWNGELFAVSAFSFKGESQRIYITTSPRIGISHLYVFLINASRPAMPPFLK